MTVHVKVEEKDIAESAGERLGAWVFKLYGADGVEVASAVSGEPETAFDYDGGQGHTATAERWTHDGKLYGGVVPATVDGVRASVNPLEAEVPVDMVEPVGAIEPVPAEETAGIV